MQIFLTQRDIKAALDLIIYGNGIGEGEVALDKRTLSNPLKQEATVRLCTK